MHQISIWEEQSFFAPQDFIITGAGFTGLWTALHLKQKYPHKKITVIEREVIPTGASGRNAGFACFGSLTEILSDINTMGEGKAMKLVKMRYDGLKMIRQYFSDNAIDYENSGGHELLYNSDVLNYIDVVNKSLADFTGDKNTFVQNDSLIEKFGFDDTQHLVINKFEGAIHSGKFLMALAQLVQSKGVQILYCTMLNHFEETTAGIVLHTNHVQKLLTDKLIFCTNAYAKHFFPEMDLTPARGQVLLTEPIHNLKVKGCFHYQEGFYYFRDFNGRILLGGARNSSFATENTFNMETTDFIQQQLEKFLTEIILPEQKPAITHRWAGTMGMGSNKFPLINTTSENSICAVRMAGMGVALAPVVGKIISEKF